MRIQKSLVVHQNICVHNEAFKNKRGLVAEPSGHVEIIRGDCSDSSRLAGNVVDTVDIAWLPDSRTLETL